MNILYFGKISENEVFVELEKKQKPYVIAQTMYEKAICEELKLRDDVKLDINTIFQTEYFPNDKLIINKNSKKLSYYYIPYINLPFLRELSYFIISCIRILFWKFKHRKDDELIIYSSNHFPPVSMAIVLIGGLLRIPKVVTFTDLPLFTYSQEKILKMKIYKRVIIKPYLRLVNLLQQKYDGYILFSKAMNKIVNKRGAPNCIVEGAYNSDQIDLSITSKPKEFIIAHAGTLNREVGIEKIIEVFDNIKTENVQLWLIGTGDMTPDIIEKANLDSRIKYFGFLPKPEVFSLLKKATLLINLRNPEDIYTKYSFPSKMFEYMVSGTPTLTTKIEGIPTEYYNYVYSVDGYESNDIAKEIDDILGKDKFELTSIGLKAREYVIQNKNASIQANKIAALLKKVIA
ncbi:glycosyltransferase [Aerococcus urinaeequi]|uniref:Glycosyl transferase family 1 domain-containing protein n=1 Tax=Aerococcus urinaeequi TaxID=51665 RepID=A0AAC9A6H7_9LACT|nr:glycosyltransferase [Aerococcus urinaeequi]AMB97022.1 hypothetical protein AWM74_01690 [Aerococcus urinaeequi]